MHGEDIMAEYSSEIAKIGMAVIICNLFQIFDGNLKLVQYIGTELRSASDDVYESEISLRLL